MNTKTTFEDRLLDELKREIGLRETELRETVVSEAGPGEPPASVRGAVVRRVVTRRRAALALAACVAAGLAVVVVPGSPADSAAYAVERHHDGSVTLTLTDMALDIAGQRELAERLRPDGITVISDVLDPGYECRHPRGERIPGGFFGDDTEKPDAAHKPGGTGGSEARQWGKKVRWEVTLQRGDSLAFENQKPPPKHLAMSMTIYAARGAVEPCRPVKSPPHKLVPVPTGKNVRLTAS
jgi:hypothetical protein